MGKWDKLKAAIGLPDDSDIMGDDEQDMDEVERPAPAEIARPTERRAASKPVSRVSSASQVNMVIIKSSDYSDARTVADHILDHRAVLLNLENSDKDMAQRILDFLSGVVYAQGGDLQRVAHSTYAVTPRNVGLQGELSDDSRDEEY
ncbi:MAG: cell division protein SepF [Clostridia bacterium]|nr:cell division protein SepF [Clostridia bacterium]